MGRIFLVCGMLISFSSCVSYHYRVTIGVSAEAEARYGEHLALEVDAAAVTADEAAEIRKAGVDGYFDPQNPTRVRLDPATVNFSEENIEAKTGRFSSRYWKQRKGTKLTNLFLIANIPPVTGVNLEQDGRLLFLPLKKNFFRKHIYIEVGSTRIFRVVKKQFKEKTLGKTKPTNESR